MMRILAVSDQVIERVYELASRGHFAGVDLIVGCGDLPYSYLEYLVTLLNVPLYYVPGNHDPRHDESRADSRAEGGINIDGRVVRAGGLLLAGLGGSPRYREGVNQYSQGQMTRRAWRMLPGLLSNRVRHGRMLDVLVTHAPPFGVHDDDSPAHRGFHAFAWLLRMARPLLLLHGHTHNYQRNLDPAETHVGPTRVINVFPYQVIELDGR